MGTRLTKESSFDWFKSHTPLFKSPSRKDHQSLHIYMLPRYIVIIRAFIKLLQIDNEKVPGKVLLTISNKSAELDFRLIQHAVAV